MTAEKKLYRYLLPSALAALGMSIYFITDTVFISVAAGVNGLAAMNLIFPVFNLLFAVGALVGTGFSIRSTLSQAGKKGVSRSHFSQAVEWELLFGLIFFLLGVLCPGRILQLLGADQELLDVGVGYLRFTLLFGPMFLLNYSLTAFIRNDHAPNFAMGSALTSSLTNILLDWIFLFPLDMGMAGAALATGLAQTAGFLLSLLYCLSRRSTISFRPAVPSPRALGRAGQLGLTDCIGQLAGGISTLVFNFILLDLAGNSGVAAYGVVANLALVALELFSGIAQGQQPLLSTLHARGSAEGEARVFHRCLLTAVLIAAGLSALTLIFPEPLCALFNTDQSQEFLDLAVPGLMIYFTGFLFASANIIRSGAFAATGQAKESFLISMIRGIFALLLFVWLLSRLFGVIGVWLSFPAAELFTLILTFFLFRKSRPGRNRNSV